MNRKDSQGRRICRWCPQVLETITYISIKSQRREKMWVCRACDSPDRPGVLEAQIDQWRLDLG